MYKNVRQMPLFVKYFCVRVGEALRLVAHTFCVLSEKLYKKETKKSLLDVVVVFVVLVVNILLQMLFVFNGMRALKLKMH